MSGIIAIPNIGYCLCNLSRTTGSLVRQYFYFRTKYSICARVVALSEKASTIQYGYNKWELMRECFPKHSRMGTARMK